MQGPHLYNRHHTKSGEIAWDQTQSGVPIGRWERSHRSIQRIC